MEFRNHGEHAFDLWRIIYPGVGTVTDDSQIGSLGFAAGEVVGGDSVGNGDILVFLIVILDVCPARRATGGVESIGIGGWAVEGVVGYRFRL